VCVCVCVCVIGCLGKDGLGREKGGKQGDDR